MAAGSTKVFQAPQEYSSSRSTRDIELRTLNIKPAIAPPEPEVPQDALSTQQSPALTRQVRIRVLSAGFSFFFAGMNDGSLGPLVPYMLRTYNIGTSFVAVMYAQHYLSGFSSSSYHCI